MNVSKKEALGFSILVVLVSTYWLAHVSSQSAFASESRVSKPQFSITLIRSPDHIGPVNISVNNTVVATDIDTNQKSKLAVPITIPGTLLNGVIRVCATGVTPPAPQICTNIQNLKQGDKSVATLDLSKAISG
jgi:hypothetical protein